MADEPNQPLHEILCFTGDEEREKIERFFEQLGGSLRDWHRENM